MAVRVFMSKLLPQVPTVETVQIMPWRTTSLRFATPIGGGAGPKINGKPGIATIAEEDGDQKQQIGSSDDSKMKFVSEDEILESPALAEANVVKISSDEFLIVA